MLPIYVVSLKQDFEKRRIIEDKMDSLQVPFEFVDAVYGKELSKEFFSTLNLAGEVSERGFSPTPGEVGCTLSHLKVYQLMLERKQDWACILEDDVILDHRMHNFYINFNNNQSKFANENLYLMGGQNGVSVHGLVAKSFFSYFYVGQQKFTKTIKSGQYLCRTCCYIMGAKLAKRIISFSQSNFLVADDWAFMAKHNIINDIYLADFVDHPEDLALSSIEKERKAGQAECKAKLIGKRSLLIRGRNFLCYKFKIYLRFVLMQFYRFKR